jgi:hypothetical protein
VNLDCKACGGESPAEQFGSNTYGTTNARELLGKYKSELSATQRKNLDGAVAHLNEARRLLNEVNQ